MASTLHNLKLKDKDGFDEESEVIAINIEIVENGYIATFILSSGEEIREVFIDSSSLLKSVKEAL